METAALRAGERLITRVCRLVPDDERDLRRQEWVAEQWGILDDTSRPWLLRVLALLVFPLPLAWTLRRGDWPTRHDGSLFDWRATANTVALYTVTAYILVPFITALFFSVGFLGYAIGAGATGAGIGAGLGAGVPAGLGLGLGSPTGAPAVSGTLTHAPSVAGTVCAVAAVAGFALFLAHSWISQQRSDERGVG
ncbi:MAG TPA: hypothetical protein VFP72_18820 [Kineosporiaceae bacterium]|nr:hypothetical protein [Kineosporiaceae bacterium]